MTPGKRNIQIFAEVIEALRNRSYVLATWNLPSDEIDCDEFKQEIFKPKKTDHILILGGDGPDYDSENETEKEDQLLLKLKNAINNTRMMVSDELSRREHDQLVAASFEFAKMMTYYFKDIDDNIDILKEVESYAEFPLGKCDFNNLRNFLCIEFCDSPKLAATGQAWIYKMWMMPSFIKSTQIRTRQPTVTMDDVMTFIFNAPETNITVPTTIKDMMSVDMRLYSDCLLHAYSKQCPSGDFIEALMTKDKSFGLSIQYIQIIGTWVLRDSKKVFKCPSLCHAFLLSRITMLNRHDGKLKNRVIKFNKNDYKLFNIPETIDFDVLDEYLPLDV
jgi:hypothetical protein